MSMDSNRIVAAALASMKAGGFKLDDPKMFIHSGKTGHEILLDAIASATVGEIREHWDGTTSALPFPPGDGYPCRAGAKWSMVNKTFLDRATADAVYATPGSVSAAIALAVVLAGNGVATTIAHSDHNHDAVYAALAHNHTALQISDASSYGRAILTASSVAAQRSALGLTGWATKTYTNGSTTDVAEGTNLYWTQARFDAAFAAKSTTNLAEGTNLYFTAARAQAAISGTGAMSVPSGVVTHSTADGYLHVPATGTTNNAKALVAGSTAGSFGWTQLTTAHVSGLTGWATKAWTNGSTTDVAEGTNLYWTQARFDAAFAAKSTTNLAEGTNLYFTAARAQAAISGTGAMSVPSGVVTHSTADGYLHVPATGTTNNAKALVAGSTAGAFAWTQLTTAHVSGLTGWATKAWTNGSTTDVAEGTNLYWTQARFDAAFTAKSTSGLAEGTNLYFTTARAQAAISGAGAMSVPSGVVTHSTADGYLHVPATGTTNNAKALVAGSTAGAFAWTQLTTAHVSGLTGWATKAWTNGSTTDVAEGTNLYWTQARFDAAFVAKSTSGLAEGTNLYFTTARAIAACTPAAIGAATAASLASYLPLAGGTMAASSGASGGINWTDGGSIRGVSGASTKSLVIDTASLRLGEGAGAWDYSQWCGIRYNHQALAMYIGGNDASNTYWPSNSNDRKISVNFVNLSSYDALTVNGAKVWNSGNLTQASLGGPFLPLTGGTISNGGAAFVSVNGPLASTVGFALQSDGGTYWVMDRSATSLAFELRNYAGSGSQVDTPITIAHGAGGGMTISRAISGTSAAFSGTLTRGGYTVWDAGNLTPAGIGALPTSAAVNYVQGENGYRSTGINSSALSEARPSGFYYGSALTDSIGGVQTGGGWTHLINMRGAAWDDSSQYAFQIAARFSNTPQPYWGPEGYYMRTIAANQPGTWRELWHSGNLTPAAIGAAAASHSHTSLGGSTAGTSLTLVNPIDNIVVGTDGSRSGIFPASSGLAYLGWSDRPFGWMYANNLMLSKLHCGNYLGTGTCTTRGCLAIGSSDGAGQFGFTRKTGTGTASSCAYFSETSATSTTFRAPAFVGEMTVFSNDSGAPSSLQLQAASGCIFSGRTDSGTNFSAATALTISGVPLLLFASTLTTWHVMSSRGITSFS